LIWIAKYDCPLISAEGIAALEDATVGIITLYRAVNRQNF